MTTASMVAAVAVLMCGLVQTGSAQGRQGGPPPAPTITTLAGAQAPVPSTIEGAEQYTLTATKSKNTYRVDVYRVNSTIGKLPENYRLPVIYVLDGNTMFPMVSQMVNTSVSFSSQLPAVLVVAIGYVSDPALTRGQNITNSVAWRNRDLTPPLSPGRPVPRGMSVGDGAPDFLAFINQDLKPFVASRYPVNLQDQTLVGHSLSGLFTIYALLNSPGSFQRYVAGSPSLFWDDHAALKQAATLRERLGNISARVFICVGELETKDRMGEDMVGDAKAMAAMLETQKDAGLQSSFRVFPDENHISVIPSAHARPARGRRAAIAAPARRAAAVGRL
jgi:predicted alpha/beta superfamily hydrolase